MGNRSQCRDQRRRTILRRRDSHQHLLKNTQKAKSGPVCPFFITSGISRPHRKKGPGKTKFELNKKIKRLVRFLFAELNNKFNLAVDC